MFAVITLLAAISLTLLVTRIGTVALMLTGISRDAARFQARSALTGVGFTTKESEVITSHPVRRRIIMLLMLVGNAGIVTVIATAVASFMREPESQSIISNYTVLLGGLVLVWYISLSEFVDRRVSVIIQWALKRFTSLEVTDYVALLHLGEGYAISEMQIETGDWIAGRTLAELGLPNEGVLVLGVRRSGKPYIGSPTGTLQLRENDVLMLYGPISRIDELDQRRADSSGDAAHDEACEEQAEIKHRQQEAVIGSTEETRTNPIEIDSPA